MFLLYDPYFFSQSIINGVNFIFCILYTCLQVALNLIFIFQQKQQNGDALDTAREFALKHNIPVHYWVGKEGWEPQNA